MLDKRFPISESPEIVVNLTFSTTVLTDGSGGEERNINWQSPLLSYDLQKVILHQEQLDEIIQFFQDTRGAAIPFRYRDWSDYLVTLEPRVTDYSSTTQGLLFPPADGSRTEFGMVKRYIVSNCIHLRAIALPNPETVTIFDDSGNPFPYTDWIFDNGKFIFTTPPSAGQLFCEGEFDVPVVFSSDEYQYRIKTAKNARTYSIEGLQLEEKRIYPFALLKDELAEIDTPFALCGHFNSLIGLREQTEVISLTSGFDKRTSRYGKPKGTYFMGKIPLHDDELEYLIAFFRCVKGKGFRWKYQDLEDNKIPVRFDEDNLTLRLNKKGRYEVDGLKAIEVFEPFAVFQTPPFSISLEPLFIDPQDPSSPSIANAGDSSYNGSQGGNRADSAPFKISTYQAEGVNFDITIPPGETGSNVSYYVVNLFWAGGTLHLLVTTNSSSSVYRNRLIHYSLNQSNGWHFQYQASSTEQLRNYTVSSTDINRASIFKTLTGVSQFFVAGNTVAFGDTANYTTLLNGLLRFEVREDRRFFISFVDNDKVSVDWNVPYMVHGDRAWYQKTLPYTEQGTFDGITYFNDAGLPITNSDLQNREYEYNIWTNNVAEPDKSEVIYHGSEAIFKYFTPSGTNPSFYLNNGQDGSYIIKVLARNVCETGKYGCSSNERNDLVYFFLKSSYDAKPILIDTQKWLNSSTLGDSHYIQTYNSSKASCDRFGNLLVAVSSNLAFYRAGSGYGINIANQIGFNAARIRSKPAVTPYGFAIMGHSGNLFGSSQGVYLTFVQTN